MSKQDTSKVNRRKGAKALGTGSKRKGEKKVRLTSAEKRSLKRMKKDAEAAAEALDQPEPEKVTPQEAIEFAKAHPVITKEEIKVLKRDAPMTVEQMREFVRSRSKLDELSGKSKDKAERMIAKMTKEALERYVAVATGTDDKIADDVQARHNARVDAAYAKAAEAVKNKPTPEKPQESAKPRRTPAAEIEIGAVVKAYCMKCHQPVVVTVEKIEAGRLDGYYRARGTHDAGDGKGPHAVNKGFQRHLDA